MREEGLPRVTNTTKKKKKQCLPRAGLGDSPAYAGGPISGGSSGHPLINSKARIKGMIGIKNQKTESMENSSSVSARRCLS